MTEVSALPRVGFLGPEGTFTEAAARLLHGDVATYVPLSTIDGVFRAVDSGEVGSGVVPIENSTEGSVNRTSDSLLDSELCILREVVLEIVHSLVARPGVLAARIERVHSHAQALAQCRSWLAENLPQAVLVEAASTSHAARSAANDPTSGALATARAAHLAGLVVLAGGLRDRASNATRFVEIGRGLVAPTGRDKTTVAFTIPHRPGSLLRALSILAPLNLLRIESRPLERLAAADPWTYAFLVDLDGHQHDAPVTAALAELRAHAVTLRVLGSYPRAET